jgi:hypothetical protein
MITFSNNSVVQFYLDQYSTQEDIRRAILSVQTLGGLTYTNLALKVSSYPSVCQSILYYVCPISMSDVFNHVFLRFCFVYLFFKFICTKNE